MSSKVKGCYLGLGEFLPIDLHCWIRIKVRLTQRLLGREFFILGLHLHKDNRALSKKMEATVTISFRRFPEGTVGGMPFMRPGGGGG